MMNKCSNKKDKSTVYFINDLIKNLNELSDEKWEGFLKEKDPLNLFPCNAFSKYRYNCLNSMILSFYQIKKSWKSNGFMTYNQIKKLGGTNKGAKGVPVIHKFLSIYEKKTFKRISIDSYKKLKDKDDYIIKTKKKLSYVFNIDEIKGLPDEYYDNNYLNEMITKNESINNVFLEIQNIKNNKAITVKELKQASAFYNPVNDEIIMPIKSSFKSENRYVGTLIHEMVHWTGHRDRLNRFTEDNYSFGSDDYAFEELVAELGSMIFLSKRNINEDMMNHMIYIKNWSRVKKGSSLEDMLYDAYDNSEKAINYLLY